MVGEGVEDSLLGVSKSGMTFVNAEISASYKTKSEPGPEIFREHAGVSERLCAARVGGLVSMQTGCMSSKEVLVWVRGSTAMVWMLQWRPGRMPTSSWARRYVV